MNNYDYPIGADTSDAPWNERDNETVNVECTISQSLSKNVKVEATNYSEYHSTDAEIDEDGFRVEYESVDYDFSNCNLEQDYKETHLTALQLIQEFKAHLQSLLPTNLTLSESRRIKYLISECEGWVEDEIEVVED